MEVLSTITENTITEKMMVSGLIHVEDADAAAVEVRRGMPIITADGQLAGEVAAVVVASPQQQVTHIILGRVEGDIDYRVVPLAFIGGVEGEALVLRVPREVMETLPSH